MRHRIGFNARRGVNVHNQTNVSAFWKRWRYITRGAEGTEARRGRTLADCGVPCADKPEHVQALKHPVGSPLWYSRDGWCLC
jgi:hypothetical protein